MKSLNMVWYYSIYQDLILISIYLRKLIKVNEGKPTPFTGLKRRKNLAIKVPLPI